MQTATVLRDFPGFFSKFPDLAPQQQYDVLWALLEKTEVSQLRKIYSKLKDFLSFDIIGNLPDELVEKILQHLDAKSLCSAAQCSRRWNVLSNKDSLWHRLCLQKNMVKYEDLPDPSDEPTQQRPSSPSVKDSVKFPPLSFLPNTCHWKKAYLKGKRLHYNWTKGVYTVVPLLRGHKKPVTAMACDGNLVASGSSDNTVRVWHAQSGCGYYTLENASDAITAIALKENILIAASADTMIHVYEANTGLFLRSLSGHVSSIEVLEFDGRTLVTAALDLSVRVWDVRKGLLMHTLIGHVEEAKCIALKGCLAATGSWDHTLRVWNIHVGLCKYTLQGHTEAVFCCLFFGEKLFSGGGDGVVKGWDMTSGGEILSLEGHREEVYCLQVNDDIIVSGSADSTIRIWNHDGKCLHNLEGHSGVVRCLHLNENTLVSGGDLRKLIVWDLKRGEHYFIYRQPVLIHMMWVDCQRIITASPDAPGLICIVNFF